MNTYREIQKKAYKKHDNNFCSVIATALTMDLNYDLVHAKFAQNGRINGQGVPWYQIKKNVEQLAKKHGFKLTSYKAKFINGVDWVWVDEDNNFLCKSNLTVNNARDSLGRGTYILGIRKHALAYVNGSVKDWSKDKKCKIDAILKIEKKVKERNYLKNDFLKFIK